MSFDLQGELSHTLWMLSQLLLKRWQLQFVHLYECYCASYSAASTLIGNAAHVALFSNWETVTCQHVFVGRWHVTSQYSYLLFKHPIQTQSSKPVSQQNYDKQLKEAKLSHRAAFSSRDQKWCVNWRSIREYGGNEKQKACLQFTGK